ncbi:MAG: hypothetical protein GXO79_14650 [Chlorobi bacterium]|nr:hypothetical protein [Chlorobiota bacterium]
MKKLRSTLSALLVVGIFMQLNLASFSQNTEKMPKYGNDSLKCIKNLSLYSEFYKQKNYSDAVTPWVIAIHECPLSSKNLYIHGDKIMKYRIQNEKDEVKKQALVDTLLNLYDQRIKYFGQEGFVIGRKGNTLLRYRPTSVEEAYNYFERSFELRGAKTEAQILVLYMQTTDALFKAQKIDKNKVVENYAKILDVIEAKIKAKHKESDIKAKNNVEIIFDKCGAATCESLVVLFTDKFKENPEDIELLKKITYLLNKTGCTESELFSKASEALYKLEPSAQSAYMLAKMFLKKQEYSKSINYYKESIKLQEDSTEKARYYYELGVLTHSQQSNPELARTYAYKALKYNPKDGKPYLLIGNIYAASAKKCGESDFEKNAVYWVVVDKFITAKRVDPSLTEEANKLIATYSKYFPGSEDTFFNGFAEGQNYTVGCWINETTKIRFE